MNTNPTKKSFRITLFLQEKHVKKQQCLWSELPAFRVSFSDGSPSIRFQNHGYINHPNGFIPSHRIHVISTYIWLMFMMIFVGKCNHNIPVTWIPMLLRRVPLKVRCKRPKCRESPGNERQVAGPAAGDLKVKTQARVYLTKKNCG